MKRSLLLLIALFSGLIMINAQGWDQISKSVSAASLNNAYQFYGQAVAVSGDYAVVGVPGYDISKGRVIVLHDNGSDWIEIAELSASDAEIDDQFGTSVSISGDRIAIGTNYQTAGVYIFDKPDLGWSDMTETHLITSSESYDYFGYSLMLDGDMLVVGAYATRIGGLTRSGAAHIYEFQTSQWVELAELTASDTDSEDRFGAAVAISGNVVAIGAYSDEENGNYSGSVYMFEKPVDGWSDMTEIQKLASSDIKAGDQFGYSLDVDGQNVLVGANNESTIGTKAGAAYIFSRSDVTWEEIAKFSHEYITSYDYFGNSVSLDGDQLVVGSYFNSIPEITCGAAYIFEFDGTDWAFSNRLTASDAEQDANLGFGIGMSGNTVITGAYHSYSDDYRSGSAYIFSKALSGWTNPNEDYIFTPEEYPNNNYEEYGSAVAVDGEYAVVGSNSYNGGEGRAYVLQKTGMAWDTIAQLRPSVPETDTNFGIDVDISGDYILVGAYKYDGIGNNSGAAYLYKKPVSGWSDMTETQMIFPSDPVVNTYFGRSVSMDNQIIVVGNYLADNSGIKSGAAYIFEDVAGVWSQTAKLTASDGAASDNFGFDVEISGDIVVVGSYFDDDLGSGSGSAYIFEKPVLGWGIMTQTAKLTASDGATNDNFGKTVSIDGEIVVIGSLMNDVNGYNSGSVYIYNKPYEGWGDAQEDEILITSEMANYDYYGSQVKVSGDYILVGSPGNDDMGNASGSSYLFKYEESVWGEFLKFNASDGQEDFNFGQAIDMSGTDIVVGARNSDHGWYGGAAYFFTEIPTEITSSPGDHLKACGDSYVKFGISAIGAIQYQWQFSADDGLTFSNISERHPYSGSDSDTLTVLTEPDLNNYQYRCYIQSGDASDTSASALLTLETESPVITSVHDDLIIDAEENCESYLPFYDNDLIATDNCGDNYYVEQSPEGFTLITGAVNLVTLTVYDGAGNSAEISFNVAVEDLSGPYFMNYPDEVSLDVNADCIGILPDYTLDASIGDYCDAAPVLTQDPVAGTVVSNNMNNVKLIATDASGNISEARIEVELVDNMSPVITCIDDQSINLAASESVYAVSGSEMDPAVEENCELASTTNDFNTFSTLDGAEFPIGITTVIWTSIDASGNEEVCSFDVTVNEYTSINQISNAEILVYPNPATDKLNIDFGLKQIQRLLITDMTGKIVFEQAVINQNVSIDISNFAKGIYFISVQDNDEVFTIKMIKE